MDKTFRHANTESMQAFLDHVDSRIRARQHAVMIPDSAGWHHTKHLRRPRCITPLFRPPYSPELNPTERLSLWLRNNPWGNRVYAEEAAHEAEAKRSHRTVDRRTFRSVCRADWITRSDQR